MKRNNYETFPCLLTSSCYQPCRQPDFPFARSGLWRIFWIALQDSRFAFHSSRIVTYAEVQKWRHSRTGVFFRSASTSKIKISSNKCSDFHHGDNRIWINKCSKISLHRSVMTKTISNIKLIFIRFPKSKEISLNVETLMLSYKMMLCQRSLSYFVDGTSSFAFLWLQFAVNFESSVHGFMVETISATVVVFSGFPSLEFVNFHSEYHP